MQATASSGNSTSQPTEQSKHLDTQFGFFLALYLKSNEVEVEEDWPAPLDVDGPCDEEELAAAEVCGPFDVEAP